mmetsp:Transcript_12507/g.35118  ORF Transcript_12507/g.35118 Transcript_12507/m.35118 type:complete len:295 (-) Transcript_12507:174-1058(-)
MAPPGRQEQAEIEGAAAGMTTASDPGSWDLLKISEGYGHRGIVMGAAKLWANICGRGILAAAAGGKLPGLDHLASWKVVVTGHSLGAGLAALIALKLRPELEGRLACWAYCPPGPLLCSKLAHGLEDIVTSVIHAKDCVPRMCWRAVMRLQEESMVALAMSKVNKNNLFWLCSSLNPWTTTASLPGKLLHDEELKAGQVGALMEKFRRDSKSKCPTGMGMDCYAPGRIIYLRPLKAGKELGKTGQRERLYNAVWITAEQVVEDGILLSKRTVEDHYTYAVAKGLLSAAERAGEE